MPVSSVQLHQDAIFGLSGVNDDIIEAPKWVLELLGNVISITIFYTQSPNVVHQEDPLLM